MKITSVQTYIRVVRRDMSSSDPYPCDTLSGLTAPSACRVREVCGLCIGQRTMTDGAMDGLFNREGCVPVSLPNFKIAHFHKNAPLAGSKQVVLCVVERNLYSKTQDKVYSVTDMRTMKARLVLSEEASRSLARGGGSAVSGKIVAILDPVASSDPSSGELVLSALQQQEVVVLGALRHMSACAGLKKDGSRCSMIADKCISEYCMYHRHSSKTVQPACNISQQARTPITAPTAPRAPVVTAKKMASEQAADLLDALLHAPQRVKAAVQTAGRAADLFSSMENGHEPSVTLEDSSDEEGRGNTNGPLPSEHESFGQVSSDLKALVGGRAMEPARRNGRVSIPQQSAVFGCFPQATGQGSGLVAASTGNPLLRKRGGDIFSNHSNITAANNRKTKYSAIGNCVVGGSSDLIASGESLLIDKSKLLSNAAAYTKLVVSQCPEHKRKAESEAELLAKRRKQAIDDLLSRKSSHAEEEKNEWFNQYNKKLEKQQSREAKTMEENEKKVIAVRAFHCKECNTILEAANALCRQRQHHISTVSTQKRYFECQQCRRRETTLGSKLPARACGFCGAFNFIATGKTGSGAGPTGRGVGLMGERLVTGKTEWSSRADIDQLARSSADL